MIEILSLATALLIIWLGTVVWRNISSMSIPMPIDPVFVKQPKSSYMKIEKSQHQKNIDASIAYHTCNDNPLPDMQDMKAFLLGAEIVDWKIKHDRLGEKDYQGEIFWNGLS